MPYTARVARRFNVQRSALLKGSLVDIIPRRTDSRCDGHECAIGQVPAETITDSRPLHAPHGEVARDSVEWRGDIETTGAGRAGEPIDIWARGRRRRPR